jgi:folate-binding protein YgfZ
LIYSSASRKSIAPNDRLNHWQMNPTREQYPERLDTAAERTVATDLGRAKADLDAARSGTILADLSHFGLIHLSGDDARDFLHAQLSCDVASLQPLSAQYGSYNTAQGRMLASFLLWRTPAGYFMQLPRALCATIQKRISKYILRSKVRATDVSDDYVLSGIAGPQAEALLQSALGAVPPLLPLGVTTVQDATLIRLPVNRFQIMTPARPAPALRDMLSKSATPAGHAAWDWLDIRAGIPFITPPTQDQFVPQMANLDLIGGVSFSKGCYPGQEIVARMHYRGRLKQRMYLANIAAAEQPQPGDKLYSAVLAPQSSGMIVSAAPSPDGGYDVLAVIQIESTERDEVHWKTPDGPALRILELPYQVPPKGKAGLECA